MGGENMTLKDKLALIKKIEADNARKIAEFKLTGSNQA